MAKAQAAGDLVTLAKRGRRCVHLHLPDNSGVTLRQLAQVIDDVIADILTDRALAEAAAAVKTGEVTWATRDSKDAAGNPIAEGDVIGIADGSIEAVDSTIEGAVLTLLAKMEADDADTCTILAGEGYADEDLEALVEKIEEAYEDLEVDAQRGEQPLYPIVFSVE